MNKKCAPLVLFVYNRLDHVKDNLAVLNECYWVENTDLYIFSDAPKNDESKNDVLKVREELEHFKNKISKFSSVTIIKADQNKGLANSIISGVTEIINEFEKVIVLEDDLAVSKDFLEYVNAALNYYQSDNDIWAISGFTFPLKAFENYPHDVYVALRGCSWGWGTWKDRWETVDWSVSDYNSIEFNWKNRLDFGSWGRDMPFMLDANHYGLNQSWAIRWCYSAYKQHKYTVYPTESRVENNGTDGSGTNYTETIHRYDTVLTDGKKEPKFERVQPNKKIQREFRRRHKKFLGVIRDHYKWLLIKIGVIKVHR